MSPPERRALVIPLLAFALLGPGAPPPAAADPPPAAAREKPKCTCEFGGGCYHFLNAPGEAPEEDCPCPACTGLSRHAGDRLPKGWTASCFASDRLDCFLKRHAASWGILCSACLANDRCCKAAHPGRCPSCGEGAGDASWTDADRAAVAARVEAERDLFTDRTPLVLDSRNFHLVTDAHRVKMRTRAGGIRWVDGHEYAHVMLMRAEQAYREFGDVIGRPALKAPLGIFLPERERTATRLKETYFRSKTTPMIYSSYGDPSQSAISRGFCLNGFCFSLQRGRSDDREMHQALRHFLGHIFVTCWVRFHGENRSTPRWMFAGAAHWLGKRLPHLADHAVFCGGETGSGIGREDGWRRDLEAMARKGSLDPIEPILGKVELGQLTYDDHRQAWSWFDVALDQWREPFVQVLADLRREKDVHQAFPRHLGVSPKEFHALWRDFMAGRRPGIRPDAAGGRPPADGAAGRADPFAGLATEEEVVARVRALGVPNDPAAVKSLLGLFRAGGSDLVRETVYLSLLQATSDGAREAIAREGLTHSSDMARAYAARLCRANNITGAAEALRGLLGDRFWLARAEAAVALGALKDREAEPLLKALCADPSPKVRIGAMDGLRGFGSEAYASDTPAVAANLDHPDWQVRVAAVQALRIIGTVEAVEPLIARMEKEAGRVRREIYLALRHLTHEDVGADPANWRRWWTKEEAGVRERGGFGPRPDPTDGGRYGLEMPPTYYGLRLFSDRVGFVLDTSRSTHRLFTPDERTRKRLGGEYEGQSILKIAQDEVVRAIRALDPRTLLSVVTFDDRVTKWSRSMQPCTPENVGNAEGFVRGRAPSGGTDLFAALVAALHLDEKGPYGPRFENTPDTITILTDGSPTAGAIKDREVLLTWYTELNRYARIRTHTVVFGQLEVDEELLNRLAQFNDGDFIQLRERNPR